MTSLTRAYIRFEKHPSSVRYAAAAIVSTFIVLILVGTLLSWMLARDDYASFGDALWFTLQTVTTVGYGDNTPTSAIGRIVASVVMLVSIGLVTVITALITSMFIRSVSRQQQEADQRHLVESLNRIESNLAAAHERLERIAANSNGEHGNG